MYDNLPGTQYAGLHGSVRQAQALIKILDAGDFK